MFSIGLLYNSTPWKVATVSSLTSGAGRFSADLETTELGSCQSYSDTQRAVSPQRDSCGNLIFECQWLESQGSQRSSQMRLFCKIYLDCHSQWCALLRRCAALGLWLSATQFQFSCFVNLGKRTRGMWREAAEVMNNFSSKHLIQGAKLLKGENKKSILPKTSYSCEDSIKPFTLGVTSSRLYAWDVLHQLVKWNKHTHSSGTH